MLTFQKKKLASSISESPFVERVVVEKKKAVPIDQQIKEIKKFKTGTVKSVAFKPKFTSMFLDGHDEVEDTVPVSPVSTTSVRYSDADLAYFRTMLLERIEREKAEVQYFRTSINIGTTNAHSNAKVESSTVADDAFSQASVGERNYIINLISRKVKLIKHLEDALIRIENKTYGICRVTGKLIDKERLKLVPHATLSKEAKEGLAHNNSNS